MMNTPTATTATDQQPHPVGAPPTSDDRYLDTLRLLDTASVCLHAALFDAACIAGDAARTQSLTDLHHRIRAMAALTNHALAGWPEPPDPQDRQ